MSSVDRAAIRRGIAKPRFVLGVWRERLASHKFNSRRGGMSIRPLHLDVFLGDYCVVPSMECRRDGLSYGRGGKLRIFWDCSFWETWESPEMAMAHIDISQSCTGTCALTSAAVLAGPFGSRRMCRFIIIIFLIVGEKRGLYIFF